MCGCLYGLMYSSEGVRSNTVCDKCLYAPVNPLHAFVIIAFNGSLSVTHWHCLPEILSKMAWFTKPLERGKKISLRRRIAEGLSSRPINHSLIRARWEWGYTFRPNISTTDSQLSVVVLLHSAFQNSSLHLCPSSAPILSIQKSKATCHLLERNLEKLGIRGFNVLNI